MADPERYQSPLTGPEMDQALLDMANHTSERFAKGTANGVAVEAGTDGYNDNSKYYKDQAANQVQLAANQVSQATAQADRAANAADRAEAAVPVGTQSAVLFTTAQTLTATQQAQARANIMAGESNPNLLMNGDFRINQRRKTSAVLNEYIADGWIVTEGDSTYTRNSDNSISVSAPTTQYSDLRQRIVFPHLTGKDIIISAKINGQIYVTNYYNVPNKTSAAVSLINYDFGDFALLVVRPGSNTLAELVAVVRAKRGISITIQEVKLEVGTYSTLANGLVSDPRMEILKCQQFAIELNQRNVPFAYYAPAFAYSETQAWSIISLPRPMYNNGTTPNIVFNNIRLRDAISGAAPVISAVTANTNVSGTSLMLVFTSSGLTIGRSYQLMGSGTNSSIFISSEL